MLRKFICFAVFLSALKVCSAAGFDPFRIDEGSATITTVALPAKPNELLNEAISKIITSENLPRMAGNIPHNNMTERDRFPIAFIGGGCDSITQLLKILAENTIEEPTVYIFERENSLIEGRDAPTMRSHGVQPDHPPIAKTPLTDDKKKEFRDFFQT